MKKINETKSEKETNDKDEGEHEKHFFLHLTLPALFTFGVKVTQNLPSTLYIIVHMHL